MIAALAFLLLSGGQPVSRPPVAEPCTRTSVEEIAAAPDSFVGRCVSVSGIAGRARLFGSVEGFYRDGRVDEGGSGRGHVGLVGVDGPAGRPNEDPVFLDIVGRVATCGQLREVAVQAGRPELVPPYCRFGLAPVILVGDQRPGSSRRIERLLCEENRRLLGTLELAPSDWDLLPQLRQAAERFRRAVAARDVAALREMHGLAEDPFPDPELLPHILDEPDSPFAELRDGSPRQLAILRRTDPGLREQARRDGFAFLCFCRTGDCSGLWPISFDDAQSRPDRPFVCTYHYPSGSALLYTSVRPGFLPEPAASAFRRRSESSRR